MAGGGEVTYLELSLDSSFTFILMILAQQQSCDVEHILEAPCLVTQSYNGVEHKSWYPHGLLLGYIYVTWSTD